MKHMKKPFLYVAGSDGTAEEEAARIAAEEAARKAAEDAEAARKAAEAAKGKPSDAEAKLLKEVMAKKEKLDTATKQIEELNKKLKEFEGIDPTEVRKLLDERKALETKKLEDAGQYEILKKQMADAHEAAMKAANQQLKDALDAQKGLAHTIGELTVGNSFNSSAYIREDIAPSYTAAKLRSLYGPHFEFKDGKVVGFDKPAGAAGRAPLVNASGDPLPFDEAFKKIIDADPDRELILKSKTNPGSGGRGTPARKPNASAAEKLRTEGMSGRERIAAALKKK